MKSVWAPHVLRVEKIYASSNWANFMRFTAYLTAKFPTISEEFSLQKLGSKRARTMWPLLQDDIYNIFNMAPDWIEKAAALPRNKELVGNALKQTVKEDVLTMYNFRISPPLVSFFSAFLVLCFFSPRVRMKIASMVIENSEP